MQWDTLPRELFVGKTREDQEGKVCIKEVKVKHDHLLHEFQLVNLPNPITSAPHAC